MAADGPEALLHLPEHGILIAPYARGVYAPDLLYHLWQMMATEGIFPRIFYRSQDAGTAHGDLDAFMAYFSKVLLFIVTDEKHVLGAMWFTDIQPQRGDVSVAYAKSIRGPVAVEVTRRICQYVFTVYGWRSIWAATPWRSALALGVASGFAHLATLPGFTVIKGREYPMYIAKLTREAHDGGGE
jgi:hypothetical protein